MQEFIKIILTFSVLPLLLGSLIYLTILVATDCQYRDMSGVYTKERPMQWGRCLSER